MIDRYFGIAASGSTVSRELRAGLTTFRAIGMDRAYTGAPSEATRDEGDALYERLAEMITVEVVESLASLRSRERTE